MLKSVLYWVAHPSGPGRKSSTNALRSGLGAAGSGPGAAGPGLGAVGGAARPGLGAAGGAAGPGLGAAARDGSAAARATFAVAAEGGGGETEEETPRSPYTTPDRCADIDQHVD